MGAVGTRLLKIKIGDQEYTAEVNKCVVVSGAADASLQTFAAAASGGARVYTLQFTAKQDPSTTTSLWNKVFASGGETATVVINPYGVTTATATAPFISGNVVVTDPDGDLLGGQADSTVNKSQTFDCSWEFDGKPVLVTDGEF